MPEEEKMIKAPPKACKVLDSLIEGLIDNAKEAVDAKNYDLAYNRFSLLEYSLAIKQGRCVEE